MSAPNHATALPQLSSQPVAAAWTRVASCDPADRRVAAATNVAQPRRGRSGGRPGAPHNDVHCAPALEDATAASMNATPLTPSSILGNVTAPSGVTPARDARIAWAIS